VSRPRLTPFSLRVATPRRIEADKAHNERVVSAEEAAVSANVDGLAEMEAELRRRAGLPPVR
jgi:hypothetical protein